MVLRELEERLALDEDLGSEVRERLLRFVELLLAKNRHVNLTRITSASGLYEAQIRDSLQLLPYLPQSSRVLDLGTGAGFPGLVLKIARPDLDMTLLDSVRKKLDFLNEVIRDLGLHAVRTVHARAEDLGHDPAHREQYGIVTARAVAKLPILAEYCLPLLRVGGTFLAMKTVDEDIAAAAYAFTCLC